MKNVVEKYYGLLMGVCGILLAVFFYLGFAQQYHVVMLIGLCTTVFAASICTYVRDNTRKAEKEQFATGLKEQNENTISESNEKIIRCIVENTDSIKSDILSSEQHLYDALQQKVFDIIENSTDIYGKFTEAMKAYQTETTKKISDSEKAIENALANSDIKFERMIEALPKQTQILLDHAITQKITPEIQKCNVSMELLKDNIEKGRSSVIEILNKNSAELSESQKNIQSQISILHRQNSHLMMLTTMIGTVRSDIAAINEVRAFIEEHKAGRKVRHVRDDEHGIFIENLMNSDGIRIEKSVMFKNDKLVFEADFDESGRMTRSKNYSENSDTFTEITYSNGTVTKSILGKIFGSKK